LCGPIDNPVEDGSRQHSLHLPPATEQGITLPGRDLAREAAIHKVDSFGAHTNRRAE